MLRPAVLSCLVLLTLTPPAEAAPRQLPQARQATVQDFAGREVSMAQWQGRVLVVNFWASWCGYCIAELPDLVATQKKWSGRGVQVVSLALGDDADSIVRLSKRYRINYPVLDGDSANRNWRRSMGVAVSSSQVPLTWVIDTDNRVLLRQLGQVSAQQLDHALSSSSAARQAAALPQKKQ
ncbi:TlpA family protein disulfide reductase [Chitinimonas lacunae]|uniref:TlpA family protein disulfide reductase n=1 Tax=Chitinimonas lacunae TaxID=1963018 RepID=A0ABV8MSQ6_9NEIS